MAPQVTLYSHPGSPNPLKVAILLEALNVSYEVINREFANDGPNGMKSAEFLKINPTGRIPALVDNENGHVVWESTAILTYIADRWDTAGEFRGKTPQERSLVIQYVSYQISTFGPALGESLHYLFNHPVKDLDRSVQERNHKELHTQFAFIDSQVKGRDWIALDRFSIADLSIVPQLVYLTQYDGLSLEGYPNLQAWVARTIAVESVKKGYKSFPGQAAAATAL
ncbi:hypothetical protein M422DRAFT_235808 [Sphaerobolus stellatus SS14]|uniref:Glutathione transferase n=1 Tax=Sphaerobolus stellatus (strain SS14) TaxID=990650 RepID=A0A0C9TF51_SPHS4|nr:hypothetical protein M422DRAFT_235808 [Sphaerobolus stellatus SS14]